MVSIDLNCDMGEGMQNDATLMPFISSANIACGYHAGDEDIMKRTAELCIKHDVAIGAHPGFDDKIDFGRKEMVLLNEEYYDLILAQLNVLTKITTAVGATLHHIKPHGALYNMAAKNRSLAAIIAKAVKDFDDCLILYGLSESYMISEAKAAGLQTASEVFADRTYQDDGTLLPRSQPKALITNEAASLKQVLQMIQQRTVTSVNNMMVQIDAETICIHGDGEYAVEFARQIVDALKRNNISIMAV